MQPVLLAHRGGAGGAVGKAANKQSGHHERDADLQEGLMAGELLEQLGVHSWRVRRVGAGVWFPERVREIAERIMRNNLTYIPQYNRSF